MQPRPTKPVKFNSRRYVAGQTGVPSLARARQNCASRGDGRTRDALTRDHVAIPAKWASGVLRYRGTQNGQVLHARQLHRPQDANTRIRAASPLYMTDIYLCCNTHGPGLYRLAANPSRDSRTDAPTARRCLGLLLTVCQLLALRLAAHSCAPAQLVVGIRVPCTWPRPAQGDGESAVSRRRKQTLARREKRPSEVKTRLLCFLGARGR